LERITEEYIPPSKNIKCQRCILGKYCGGCLFIDENTLSCDELIDIFMTSLKLKKGERKQ
jgi:hypothetical protein